MPTNTIRAAARLAATVLLVLLVSGCADKTASTTTTSPPASPAVSKQATTSAVAPTTTTVPPMTAGELAWLKAVTTLRKTIDKAFMETGPVYLTRAKMRSYANTLRSCSRELARIGSLATACSRCTWWSSRRAKRSTRARSAGMRPLGSVTRAAE